MSSLPCRDEVRVTLPFLTICLLGSGCRCSPGSSTDGSADRPPRAGPSPVWNTVFPQLAGLAAPHPSGLTGMPQSTAGQGLPPPGSTAPSVPHGNACHCFSWRISLLIWPVSSVGIGSVVLAVSLVPRMASGGGVDTLAEMPLNQAWFAPAGSRSPWVT